MLQPTTPKLFFSLLLLYQLVAQSAVITQRNDEGWLTLENIINFPIQDLYRIDQLWLEYSRGKFGISVQQQIYQSLGGTKEYNQDVWRSMGDRVGWRQWGSWLSYSNLNFSQTAQSGHLPICLIPIRYPHLSDTHQNPSDEVEV
ncbi:GUN4 domain-containing protein, partial [Cylindrospermopsis raciborskii]|uniref:GUN4 domain-containing protein n=1 Tax=Cylindrospermopsis raciborskii TaxID=77022 RepID=UPI0022CB3D4E